MSGAKKGSRKISCLPCRIKKAKCDAGTPHCARCVRNSRENQCIYPKPRTFGRPPKRAVFLKNQDLMISSAPTALSTSNLNVATMSPQATDTIQCREFIFENNLNNHENNQLIKTSQSQHRIKYHDQISDIERIFSLYVARGYHLRQKLSDFELNSRTKAKSLLQHFTWHTSDMIGLTIRRACQLMELDSFFDPEIAITAFLENEECPIFFFNSNHNSNQQHQRSSPLESIPPEQAIQLIDYFFELQPNSILLNKTRLLHSYWNDSVEPLLLSVIYGIAIYTCQQTAKGSGFKLWDTNRNPFLNYAYTLMEDFFSQRDTSSSSDTLSSLENYQAAVILGIFETMFGLPKHGMTILSLSYMMASDLGIFQYVDESSNIDDQNPKIRPPMDTIDKEQLVNTYWAALRSTAYGCIELGLYLRENILFHGQPFPPANAQTSASYQYDMEHDNHSRSSAYLMESFHTDIVITYFTSKLFSCLPKTEYNLFGCKTTPATAPSIEEMQSILNHHMLLQLFTTTTSTADPYNSLVDCRIQMVLYDFSTFIQQEKHRWSPQQSYIIETTYYLYYVHFSFIKSCNNVAPIRYHKMTSKLDLNDAQIAGRIRNLQPTTWILIDLLQRFLKENEEKDLNQKMPTYFEEKNTMYSSVLVPSGIMSMALETIVELTILQYQLDTQPPTNKKMDQIKTVNRLTKHHLFWIPQQQAAIKQVCKKLKSFLRQHHISIHSDTSSSAAEAALLQQSHTSMSILSQQEFGGLTAEYNVEMLMPDTIESASSVMEDTFFLEDFDTVFQDSFGGLY